MKIWMFILCQIVLVHKSYSDQYSFHISLRYPKLVLRSAQFQSIIKITISSYNDLKYKTYSITLSLSDFDDSKNNFLSWNTNFGFEKYVLIRFDNSVNVLDCGSSGLHKLRSNDNDSFLHKVNKIFYLLFPSSVFTFIVSKN